MTTPPPPPSVPGEPGNVNNDGLARPQNDDDKTMGIIAHAGAIIAGFLAPLIIMLAKKDSAYAQQEAKEALNFSILITIISIVTCGIGWIVGIIFFIIAAVSASKGEPYRYPFNWRLIK